MKQDLREILKQNDHLKKHQLKKGHEKRFAARLKGNQSSKRKSVFYKWKVAATFLVLLSMGLTGWYFYFGQPNKGSAVAIEQQNITEEAGITLGDLSPDLKKVETYFTAHINLELSSLSMGNTEKDRFNDFLTRLQALDAEYKLLNEELNSLGPNQQTVTALIKNLQIRLELLQQLNKKIENSKKIKNENKNVI